MNRRTTPVAGSLAAGLVALMLAGLSTVAQAADPIPGAGTTVGTVADPANPFATQPGPTGRTATVSPPIAKIGDSVIVTGSAWPAGSLVSVAVCGNNYLNGSSDCEPTGQGQTTANANGEIAVQVALPALPPTPCPCVVHLATLADTNTVDVPFTITGAPTAVPSHTVNRRSVDVSARLTGSGPFAAYIGGAAKRELVVSVTNTGSSDLINPALNLTVGRGENPATPLTSPSGQQPALGTIAPGQTVEYRQSVTLGPPAFGQYRVKGEFIGLDLITVDQQNVNAGVLSFSVATSSYPWLLILIAWLLLQIPLLGLYKRRPVEKPLSEDPLIEQLPVASGAPGFGVSAFDPTPAMAGAPVALAAAVARPVVDTPAPPPPPGYRAIQPASATPPPAPLPPMPAAPGEAPSAVPAPSTPAPAGVEALRALLQPPTQ
ncbi:MAG TPA: hypothetical protein DCR52_01335 [Actinobacteria bacterium]|nr:hypothetical protein [Actinomycetota bacterium]